MERRVIVIVGPTCSGKTSLSLSLAGKLNTEIISADSRQIYKYLNIGTAKPLPEELKRTKHHFIDYLNLDETYNVSKYENDSLEIIEKLFDAGKIPIVAGGSGLYIKALVDGIFDNVETDEDYREELQNLRTEKGNEYLYEELKKVDPVGAARMLPQNWKRVMRAMEVYHITGKPIWELHEEHKRELDIEFLQYGLSWERETLYQNIEKRVDSMIEEGLVKETEDVLNNGCARDVNALNTVGYKEIISYLDCEVTLERAIELIKRNTRRYAKRQLTWFRRDTRIKWMDVESSNDLKIIEEKLIEDVG